MKQTSLKWPSAKRGFRKIMDSIFDQKNNKADIEQYEGGESKENSVTPMV